MLFCHSTASPQNLRDPLFEPQHPLWGVIFVRKKHSSYFSLTCLCWGWREEHALWMVESTKGPGTWRASGSNLWEREEHRERVCRSREGQVTTWGQKVKKQMKTKSQSFCFVSCFLNIIYFRQVGMMWAKWWFTNIWDYVLDRLVMRKTEGRDVERTVKGLTWRGNRLVITVKIKMTKEHLKPRKKYL